MTFPSVHKVLQCLQDEQSKDALAVLAEASNKGLHPTDQVLVRVAQHLMSKGEPSLLKSFKEVVPLKSPPLDMVYGHEIAQKANENHVLWKCMDEEKRRKAMSRF